MPDNILQKVEAYASEEALPQLLLELDILDIANTKYDDWNNAERVGTRGGSIAFALPSRHVTRNSLALPTPPEGGENFNERRTALAITQQKASSFTLSAADLATYDFDQGSLNANVDSVIGEIATNANKFATDTFALSGYRFLGIDNPLEEIPSAANLDYTGTIQNIRRFFNYGGRGRADYIIPSTAEAQISGTGQQRFTPSQNDELARDWSIGQLVGTTKKVNFYASDLLPVHTAGTACDSATPSSKITITSVTDTTYTLPGTNTVEPASTIELDGDLTDGNTFVEGDMFDIVNNSGISDIKFLQFIGHNVSVLNPQCKVVTGGTVASGTVTLTVIPRLKHSAIIDPDSSLSRDIVTGSSGDIIRPLKSHTAGFLQINGYSFFAAPRLETTDPYPSKVINAEDGGVSMLMYYGYIPQSGGKAMDHQMIYGALGVPEGIARIPFKTESLA